MRSFAGCAPFYLGGWRGQSFVASTPLKKKKKTPKRNVRRGIVGAAAKAKGPDLRAHLVTAGNTVWTSGNRGVTIRPAPVSCYVVPYSAWEAVYTCGSSGDRTPLSSLSDMTSLAFIWAVLSVVHACGKESHDCRLLCGFCDGYFSGNRMDCFLFLLEHSCLKPFNDTMNHNITDWCDWSHVSGLYSSLSVCTEDISDCMPIPWPNPPVETMFLDIHSRFFQDCPSEELSDPPPAIIFALVITPICLIPLMVSLVVLKTKNGDGSP